MSLLQKYLSQVINSAHWIVSMGEHALMTVVCVPQGIMDFSVKTREVSLFVYVVAFVEI